MDKITFENLPSETTAVSAENMNLMQNNIEKSANYIGSTQPSTGEKVWIKKGKNMLDMSSIFGLGTLNNDTGLFVKVSGVTLISSSSSSVVYKTETKWGGIVYSVSVLPSTQYTLKFSTNYPDDDYIIIEGYQKNGTRTRRIIASGDETITFTTNANEYEIKICIETGSLTNTNITISNLQLEQGSSATTFEPYIEKEIQVKNDNGIFEKFYSEYYDNYSLAEQKIGTWIDGKTLYRRVLVFTELSSSYSMGNGMIEIISIRGIIKRKDLLNTYMKVESRLNESSWLASFGNIQTVGVQKINMYYGSSWTNTTFDKLIVIVEYTKTTD